MKAHHRWHPAHQHMLTKKMFGSFPYREMQEWEKILYREVGYQESGKPCVPVFMFWV
jgi:hypothetical protein